MGNNNLGINSQRGVNSPPPQNPPITTPWQVHVPKNTELDGGPNSSEHSIQVLHGEPTIGTVLVGQKETCNVNSERWDRGKLNGMGWADNGIMVESRKFGVPLMCIKHLPKPGAYEDEMETHLADIPIFGPSHEVQPNKLQQGTQTKKSPELSKMLCSKTLRG